MDNPKEFHLLWPILMLILVFSLRKPELKGTIERSNDPVFASSGQQAIGRNSSVPNRLEACMNGFRNRELVNDREPNRPGLFETHPSQLRSSAVSIHDPNNLVSIVAIILVSILMGFILITLFQR